VHSYWGLPADDPPDFVCFSKKFQSAGYYYRDAFAVQQPYRIYNTWMGDPLRALQMNVITATVRRDHLLDNARITGEWLHRALTELSSKYPHSVDAVRGRGTLLAFDAATAARRDEIVVGMRQLGVQSSGCGTRTIRIRPTLVFQPVHARMYVDRLAEFLSAH